MTTASERERERVKELKREKKKKNAWEKQTDAERVTTRQSGKDR